MVSPPIAHRAKYLIKLPAARLRQDKPARLTPSFSCSALQKSHAKTGSTAMIGGDRPSISSPSTNSQARCVPKGFRWNETVFGVSEEPKEVSETRYRECKYLYTKGSTECKCFGVSHPVYISCTHSWARFVIRLALFDLADPSECVWNMFTDRDRWRSQFNPGFP